MRSKRHEQKKNSNDHNDKFEKCAVKDCDSVVGDDLKFFQFPKDEKSGKFNKLAEIWSTFTRIKNFKPNKKQVICELHFAPECINKKKNLITINSVPKIYYRDGKKVEVLYNEKKCEYYGKEAKKMFKETEELSENDRFEKVKNIKSLCRFCFTNNDCSPFDHYKSHSINFYEIIDYFEIDKQNDKCFNEIICSLCFEKILDFEKYRSGCQNAYKKLLKEMQEYDKKTEVNNIHEKHFLIVKSEVLDDPLDGETDIGENDESVNNNHSFDNFEIVTENNDNSCISIINEQISDVNDDDDADSDDTAAFQELLFKKTLKEKIEQAKNKLRGNNVKINVKKEPEIKLQEFSDDDFGVNDMSFGNDGFDSTDEEILNELPPTKKQKLDNEAKVEENIIEKVQATKPPKAKVKKEKISTDHKQGKRSFQCFFCRVKFLGSKVYERHNCDRKIKCSYENCDNEFTNTGGYNQHIFHKHGLPKMHKEFCPSCNTIFQMNAIEFNDHCQQCSIENNFADKETNCPQCEEVFPNFRSFTAHKLIHETEILKKAANREPVEQKKRKTKYVKMPKNKICDICGKAFDAPGLARHKDNVHLVDFKGQMYYCDLCPIAKPTKRLLQNHVRRTHVINWHPCEICGKMFKNRDTWKKHQMVHTNSKDDNRCDICPSAPGFVTPTELRKHMATYHGGDQPVRNFVCSICENAYSRDDQLVRHLAAVHGLTENNYTKDIIRQMMKN